MSRKPPPLEAWLLAGGKFGRELANAILSYPAFIFWGTGDTADTDDEVSNGTTFFLDCGQGPFGVTAGHVYEAHKARADTSGVLCQIGRPSSRGIGPVDLRQRLIAHSHSPDIATYKISAEEIDRIGARVVTASKEPREDDIVAFVGFPGSGREILAPRSIAFEPFHGAAFVESMSLETVSCPIPHEWIIPIEGMRFPEPGEDTDAGLSGGPMFCFDRGAVLSWRLLGVICDGGGGGHEGEGGPFLDVIVAARADLINADGTINELPRPRRQNT
jgi:hypothetical protein